MPNLTRFFHIRSSIRSEEHTSELQSPCNLVCRLLLEKKNYEPESSAALGFGFRCGFLVLLHMEIVQERLEREYDLNLLATAPSVEHQVTKTNGHAVAVDNPTELPPPQEIAEIREPWMDISIVCPERYIGAVMELVTGNRGEVKKMEYLQHSVLQADGSTKGEGRVILEYRIPLSEILIDFYDELKSRTQG